MVASELAKLLSDQRTAIVSRFVVEVQRTDLSPAGVSRSLLVDHIPGFIDEIVAELQTLEAVRVSQDSVDTSQTARQHGEQRWNLGYDLESLIREYGVLRHCIFDVAKAANVNVTLDELDILSKCLSVGVAEAATQYASFRDAELNAEKANLAFLAEAGQLLSSSLDYRSTLNRLTGLLVPRMADWCVIHLDGVPPSEMPVAHVDESKREALRALYTRWPLASDSPYGHANVVETGEPRLIATLDWEAVERSASDPEQLTLLRSVRSRSLVIVPLRAQATVFGALTLAYGDSGRSYDAADLVFANELARRAAAAIDNARLYDLSQRERSRVEAATRARDEFVAMVSHELRTPLNAILGWLRLMRSGTLSPARQHHALDVVERNANAQNRLVSDLLDISKIIAGKIRINPSQVDFADVVDMAVEGIRPAAEAKRIAIDTEVDREGSVMRGDGDRLQQILWNLLANAVKFTPKGGRVSVKQRRVQSDLELTVTDNGEGIAASFLPHVFESFRQSDTSSTRAHGGLGIGLSITKHLVELHGGVIEARSDGPGRGATFVVRLPMSSLVSTTLGVTRVPATQPALATNPLPTGLEGLRVLILDDEADARDLVAYVLETSGMDVRAVESVADALQELASSSPDVIISDVGMPGEDGYSFIRRLRTLADPVKKNIPAIALTAFARNEDRTRSLVAGFNLHLAKPVEPRALVEAVAELAGRAQR